jgi:hypothetical protein
MGKAPGHNKSYPRNRTNGVTSTDYSVFALILHAYLVLEARRKKKTKTEGPPWGYFDCRFDLLKSGIQTHLWQVSGRSRSCVLAKSREGQVHSLEKNSSKSLSWTG